MGVYKGVFNKMNDTVGLTLIGLMLVGLLYCIQMWLK